MNFSRHFLPSRSRPSSSGFSLIEVMLAMGIVAFAMLGIIGLLPVGLTSMRSAINTTIESQIVQSVASDLQLTDFANQPTEEQTLWYDDQGTLTVATDAAATYRVVVTAPVAVNPAAEMGNVPSPMSISSDSVVQRTVQISNKTMPGSGHSFPIYIARTSGDR